MAEERDINIKILIDAANAAKTVGETRKALRDLLVAAQEVEEGSIAFNEINKSAGELKDRIGDLQANVKFFANDLRNLTAANEIAQGIAASFGIVQGSLEALGLSTKTAEEATKQLVAIQSVLNGLMTIGNLIQKESAANIGLTNLARALGINLVVAETTATEGLTLAQKALNLVMKLSPMGLLIGATTALIGAYTLLTQKTDKQVQAEKNAEAQKKKLIEEQKEYTSFIAKEVVGYNTLIAQLSKTNPQSKERLDLINKINETYGTSIKNLSDETKFQNQLNLSVQQYIEFLKQEFILKSNQEKLEVFFQKQIKYEEQLVQLSKDKLVAQARYDILTQGLKDFNKAQAEEAAGLAQVNEKIVETTTKLGQVKGTIVSITNSSIDATNRIAETGLRLSSETVEKVGNKVKNENKNIKTETEKLIDALIEKQVTALQTLKDITIQINSENVKPKLLENLIDLNKRVKGIKDEVGSLIPNVKTFTDAFTVGTEENIGILDEFGVKFDAVRKRLIKGYFGDRDAFVKIIQDIREEFKNAEPEQLSYINSITESYLKAKDILKPFNVDQMSITIDNDKTKKELKTSEEILNTYFDNIKSKLQFEGVEFFGVDPSTIKTVQGTLEDVNKTVDEKINALISIQFTGKKKLENLNKELIDEQNKLATLQTQSGGDVDILQQYSEDRIKIIENEIKTIEAGIKTIQTTVTTQDFDVIRELFPAKNFNEILTNLETIRSQFVKTALDAFKAANPKATQDQLNEAKKLYSDYLAEFEKTIETTTKNENAVRGFTFQIQELGKELGKTTNDATLFFTALEKDLPNIMDKFDFKKLQTEYRDFANETKSTKPFGEGILNFFGVFPKKVAEGNAEATLENQKFLQENTKTINEFLIKNGVSAELLARLSTDQIKKLNKIFITEAAKTDDQVLKERRQKYLEFYTSLTSSIFGFIGQIAQNSADATISVLNQEKEAALDRYDAEIEAAKFKDQELSNSEQLKADKEKKITLERAKIQEEYDNKIKEAEYQGAVAKWNYAITEAIIQSALAVLKAAPNPFAMGAAAILGGLQVATIQANKPAKYATGGVIFGPGGPKDDKVPAYLSNGESVINANSTKMFLPMLDMINRAGGGAPLINTPNPMMANGGIANQSQMNNFSRLEDLIMQVVDRPIKTYVVSSDVSSAQSKDKRLKDRTTF